MYFQSLIGLNELIADTDLYKGFKRQDQRKSILDKVNCIVHLIITINRRSNNPTLRAYRTKCSVPARFARPALLHGRCSTSRRSWGTSPRLFLQCRYRKGERLPANRIRPANGRGQSWGASFMHRENYPTEGGKNKRKST